MAAAPVLSEAREPSLNAGFAVTTLPPVHDSLCRRESDDEPSDSRLRYIS